METTQTNNFTDEEKALAERYKVEPKTCRLIAEIVSEHTEGISQLIELMQGKKKPEPDAKLEKPEMPRTDDPFLDEWLGEMTYNEACIAYACLEISWVNNALGDKLSAALRFKAKKMLREYRKSNLDVECEVTPGLKWLSFYRGMKANEESIEDLISDKPEQTEEPQPKEAALEKPEPKEPQLIEGPTPITALQNWLSKRTYSEKLLAVLLWQLLNKESIYKDEGYCKGNIGDELFKQYEQTVIDASQDKEYLDKADSEEIVVTAMTTALLPMQV